MSPIFPVAAEHRLRGALNRAIRSGLHIIAGAMHERTDRLVGVCVLGAAELDGSAVLSRLPQGARVAIADGFDGQPFDDDLNNGLRVWWALGERLRRAYRPRRVRV